MVIGITSKKEMGIAVRAIAQYADDCMGNGDYVEMVNAFKIALNMANMYELREEEDIKHFYHCYVAEAMDTLKEIMEEGRAAQNAFDELEEIADL